MKIKIKKTCINDLDKIYELQNECFDFGDRWYKNSISQYLNNSFILEYNNNIIGVLLQGLVNPITPNEIFEKNNNIIDDVDIINNLYKNELNNIVMLCIHPLYRNKGLAQILINEYFDFNKNKILCLNTRKSNINAFNLYLKMGYKILGNIINKYFLPNEDSYLMIKYN
jgi:ribosomal protein S18 acetylase RimI-like enzyme